MITPTQEGRPSVSSNMVVESCGYQYDGFEATGEIISQGDGGPRVAVITVDGHDLKMQQRIILNPSVHTRLETITKAFTQTIALIVQTRVTKQSIFRYADYHRTAITNMEGPSIIHMYACYALTRACAKEAIEEQNLPVNYEQLPIFDDPESLMEIRAFKL